MNNGGRNMVNLGSSKDKGKVSVVVTFKDLDNVAGRMINSLIEQTYKNLEIICVDDNSSDGTLEVLNEFAKNDSRITVIANRQSLGVSKSRNIGIDSATGKFLIVVDGDDEMIFDGIEHLVNAFDEETDCVVAGFKQTLIDDTTNFCMPNEKISGSPKDEVFFEKLMRYSNQSDVCCYTRMYRREVVKARYKEGCNYQEQTLFAFEMLLHLQKIRMIPVVVYNYSPYPYPKDSLSKQARCNEFKLTKLIVPEIQEITESMFPKNKFALFLSSFCLISAITMQARMEILSGKDEEEIVENISNNLKDSLVVNTFVGVKGKTVADNEFLSLVQDGNAKEIYNGLTGQQFAYYENESLEEIQVKKTIYNGLFFGVPTIG